jgi:diaminopimelate dehydrogenase
MTDRPGVSLHHTLTARSVAGVRDAVCTELRSAEGKLQRYVYVELAPGADSEEVTDAIRSEPLFLDEETLVFPVESVAALEEEGRGVVLERRGTAGVTSHQMLLLEARFDMWSLAAQVMVAAARVLPDLPPGAYALSEVPLSLLLGFEPSRPDARRAE